MSFPSSGVEIPFRPPYVATAEFGTVIGVMEVIDQSGRTRLTMPLRAGVPGRLPLPEAERCLVAAWSPYVTLRPTVVTAGSEEIDFGRLVVTGTASSATGSRSKGWLRLWHRSAGQWVPYELPAAPDGDTFSGPRPVTPPLSETPGDAWVLQAKVGRGRPACTVVPGNTAIVLRPAAGRYVGRVEVWPAADSGFTLLEALRAGRMEWARTIERIWWDESSAMAPVRRSSPSLFDLAVGYLYVLRGEPQELERRLERMAGGVRANVLMGPDIAALRLWLALRTRRAGNAVAELERLDEERVLPAVAEGLRVLSELPPPTAARDARSRLTLPHWLPPYLNATAPTTFTQYTAAAPDRPSRRPARDEMAPPTDEAWTFTVSPARAGGGGHVRWSLPERDPWEIAAAAAEAPSEAQLQRAEGRWVLTARHEDPRLLWEVSVHLLTSPADVSVTFTTPHTAHILFTDEAAGDLDRELRRWIDNHDGDQGLRFTLQSSAQRTGPLPPRAWGSWLPLLRESIRNTASGELGG
ncbi:hypothetical protein [Streptomyces mirabilis]|uniref:hypothetical protein n=1 Tax=Streptomyces mirabilis TaxID=68239 RepID=UPI00167EF046|nr:hypothetical protein [Streptomyces mirabilis]